MPESRGFALHSNRFQYAGHNRAVRPAELPSDLDYWLDSHRITLLVNRYFYLLDEQDFDETRFHSIFQPDAVLTRPNGSTTVGPRDIAASHARSFARFESSQHLLTGQYVESSDESATFRANLVAIHIWKDHPARASLAERSFTAGGVATAKLVRTSNGWRITELHNRVVWRTGVFGDMKSFE